MECLAEISLGLKTAAYFCGNFRGPQLLKSSLKKKKKGKKELKIGLFLLNNFSFSALFITAPYKYCR